MKEYRFPYHGLERACRAVVRAPDGMFPGENLPFCFTMLLGQFLERMDDTFAMPAMTASFHVPVTARGKTEIVHVELASDVDLKDKDLYDDAGDAAGIEDYKDGTVRITKYAGPLSWRSEDWSKATVAAAGMDRLPGA